MTSAKVSHVGAMAAVLLAAGTALRSAAQTESLPVESPVIPPAASGTTEPAIKARLELHIPSLSRLIAEFRRSHAGVFAEHLGRTLHEVGSLSPEGIDVERAAGLLELIKSWPDTSVNALTYAPDTEGRARWAIRCDWPLNDLRARVSALLHADAAGKLLEGAQLTARPAGGYELTLHDVPMAYLLSAGELRSCVASHADLDLPETVFAGPADADEPPLLACRLNLAGTETDSGAMWWSSIRAVTSVDYTGRVAADGDWAEEVQVHWPPLVGIGGKALLDKVKQTFFVPDVALGALTVSTMAARGMLDPLVGFGPQMIPDETGGMTMINDAASAPIGQHAGAEVCVSLIPGTGFIPIPDFVVQSRVKRPEKFVEDVREAARKLNEQYRRRGQKAPWHEAAIGQRCVFWSDGGGGYRGAMMPATLRAVIFTTRESDAAGKERDLLVIGWTSTSPQRFAQRWLELPRHEKRRFLPATDGTYGQAWLNWKNLYAMVHPYVNLAISAVVPDTLLPRTKEIAEKLTEASFTLKVRYTGLSVAHRGPLPAGALLVPVLTAMSLEPDESGGSDIARERLACQRLQVLYHHCKLFKKDTGRWPATLAELDGYVDFSGHPELLRLNLSPKRQWTQWFESIKQPEPKKNEAADDDAVVVLDEKLYVIEWRPDRWTLGYAAGTLDHLEKLYVDQDGRIHRVEKTSAADTKSTEAREPAASTSGTTSQE
jgi:hypothetical protein